MRITLLFISTLFFGQLGNNYSIHVNVVGCECPERDYFGYLLLSRDNQLIDSVSMRVNKLITISGYYKMRETAKFRNLQPGDYSISYRNFYKQDSIVNITIGSERITEIEICHDRINSESFIERTAIDNLQNGDTLFINSYKSAGEFGGFDEGFWIWKSYDKVKGAFFYLADTYELGWESRLTFYEQHKKEAQFKSAAFELTDEQIEHIRYFLIESNYYPQYKWPLTNAPDFLTIYSRTDTLERTRQEWNCNSYLKLREKLTPANNR